MLKFYFNFFYPKNVRKFAVLKSEKMKLTMCNICKKMWKLSAEENIA